MLGSFLLSLFINRKIAHTNLLLFIYTNVRAHAKKTALKMKNIIFIGGIHGVGKGTLCEKVCNDLNIRHLSASEVLK